MSSPTSIGKLSGRSRQQGRTSSGYPLAVSGGCKKKFRPRYTPFHLHCVYGRTTLGKSKNNPVMLFPIGYRTHECSYDLVERYAANISTVGYGGMKATSPDRRTAISSSSVSKALDFICHRYHILSSSRIQKKRKCTVIICDATL